MADIGRYRYRYRFNTKKNKKLRSFYDKDMILFTMRINIKEKRTNKVLLFLVSHKNNGKAILEHCFIEDDFYNGPGLDSIPGRIQSLNPYNRVDEMASATFGGFKRRPSSASGGDCDFYTDSLCLEVTKYPT